MEKTGIAYHAIANFVMTMDLNLPLEVHMYNADLDRWMYGWNEPTSDALQVAILTAYEYASLKG